MEATVVALVDTVLRHREIILNELGNKPLFFPFPFFMVNNLLLARHRHAQLRPLSPPPAETNISDQKRNEISSDCERDRRLLSLGLS